MNSQKDVREYGERLDLLQGQVTQPEPTPQWDMSWQSDLYLALPPRSLTWPSWSPTPAGTDHRQCYVWDGGQSHDVKGREGEKVPIT